MRELSGRLGVLWKQVRAALEKEIQSGLRRPGERVETESVLAARFGVNRHTIRRALLSLQEDGVIVTEHGRGSFVAEPVVKYRLGRRTRFSPIVESQALSASRKLLGITRKPAEEAVAEALGITPGAPIVEIESLGFADGRPTGIGLHHFDEKRFPGIGESYRETLSVTAALERYGVTDYTRRESVVTAVMPTQRDCELLEQSATKPILLVMGVNVDDEDNPIEYSVSRMPTVRMNILVSQTEIEESLFDDIDNSK